ncbi:acetylcholinesterase [Dermatophagoides farinae]|uniref:acetylcholinesterase n=1 Tax=Dermatophagoides farinae TaxID=6954 RepID=UPI003F60C5A4
MFCHSIINALLIWLTGHSVCFEKYAPIIQLGTYGKIRGIVQNEPLVNGQTNGMNVYFYQGIRYGKARRFDRPERADSWSDIYDAIEYRDACPQSGLESGGVFRDILNQTKKMSEDCLFLNVWTTKKVMKLVPGKRSPVMVFIHGGFFKIGTIFNNIYDGGVLAANGQMVVVSIAYRLGPFGFLYTGDEPGQSHGNQGLYDQILALQWIQENIHYFGGDPTQVTVFGQSSGSFSVSHLILSPLANGLFYRAILQSGSCISYAAYSSKSREQSKAKKIAKKLNCMGNMTEITECLREKSFQELLSVSFEEDLTSIYESEFSPLRPVDALKNDHYNINQVDIMFGVTRDEGDTYIQNSFTDHEEVTVDLVREKIRQRVTNQSIVEDVVSFYTKNLSDSSTLDEKINSLSRAYGDYRIVCPTILFGKEYHRRFSHTKQYSYRLMVPVKSIYFGNKWNGVGHMQDLFYMFGIPYRFSSNISFTQQERDLSRDMIDAWIRFAQDGIQTTIGTTNIEWTKAFDGSSSSSVHFMALNSENYRMISDYFEPICDGFWRSKIFV